MGKPKPPKKRGPVLVDPSETNLTPTSTGPNSDDPPQPGRDDTTDGPTQEYLARIANIDRKRQDSYLNRPGRRLILNLARHHSQVMTC